MARKSLVEEVATDILDRIIAGEFPPGAMIPGEHELTGHHAVSRMTVREAMKTLEAQGIVSVQRGRGTSVNPVHQWNSWEAMLRAVSEQNREVGGVQLIELRRMLETGAAELAATKVTDADLDALEGHLRDMHAGHESGDVDQFVAADLAFHDVIMDAAANVFLLAVFKPLHRVLIARRRETSRDPVIQAHALVKHRDILDALRARDAVAARAAMDSHMEQTLQDLVTIVQASREAQV
ncbi:FadR family transcriptional regulator [Micrococcales bacterium 31B]|nr:FadR family transcriptional regulator [Micrococcales bacterium 31B]